MANDNELTADGAGNGNGNNEQVITKNANDSTQKMDEMIPSEKNRDDTPEQLGHDVLVDWLALHLKVGSGID